MKFQNMLTFFVLKCFLRKKSCWWIPIPWKWCCMWMKSMKNYEEIYISSNNLVHNGFATVSIISKVKMVTYTFQKLLHWKRGFPQVQFLLLFSFKSDALALIWTKSLSRGWPLYAIRNQLYGNTESPMSLTWAKRK